MLAVCRSYYSFLEGVCSPEALVMGAKERGYPYLFLADRSGFYGVIPFYRACIDAQIQPLIGTVLTMEDGDELTLLALDDVGYRAISKVITYAYRGCEKGCLIVSWALLERLEGEVVCLTGSKAGRVYQAVVQNKPLRLLQPYLLRLQRIFKEVYLSPSFDFDAWDHVVFQRYQKLGVPVLPVHQVLYVDQAQGDLGDLVCCIRQNKKIDDPSVKLPGNHRRELLPFSEGGGQALADRSRVTLDFSQSRLPKVNGSLAALARSALSLKYPDDPRAGATLEKELQLIEALQLKDLFLIVHNIVEYAKSRGIRVQGRGSAANSLVAYLLGITAVDPIRHDLFLGRFIHEGMKTVPDIDLDFASKRDSGSVCRDDVIQYVEERYGKDHVATVATFITFRRRSAEREVTKVLGCTNDRLVEALQGLPRHLSVHVGGMCLTACPTHELVPVEPARMEERFVCQWDKDMVEDAGLIKIDLLGLGMLAALSDTCQLIQRSTGECIDLDTIECDDPAVYKRICGADTVGVFQLESRAQMQSLPRTQPRNFRDLGVQVAIIRPGPLQGNMVAPYIRRRQGKEPVSHMHESLEPILSETLGVILFQEQVLQVAQVIAGLSDSEAEGLRRAMSRKRSRQAMEKVKERFMRGAKVNGVEGSVANRIYQSLEGFALYGFCKSHALSFARIAYVSAYCKHYYPAAFTAALLNNQPMGFYPKKTLIDAAKRQGVTVVDVGINQSEALSFVNEEEELVLGLHLIKGVSYTIAEKIVSKRLRAFHSLPDLLRQVSLNERVTQHLIQSGACDCFGLSRRELLWQLYLFDRSCQKPRDLFSEDIHTPALPYETSYQRLVSEWREKHFSVSHHPIQFFRAALKEVVPSHNLADYKWACFAGLVVSRQRPPTAKGFAFYTLEDEFGMVNVVFSPRVFEDSKELLASEALLLVWGDVQFQEGVLNLMCHKCSPLLAN